MRPQDKVARTAPVRARKNRVRWCGGHVGREHEPEVRLDKTIESMRSLDPLRYDTRCRWALWTVSGWPVNAELHYSCGHQWACKACGRILKFRVDSTSCPQWRPGPAGPVSELRCNCNHALVGHDELTGCAACGCRRFVLPKEDR